ncbi:MAG: tandem-95 repeat protein [Zoogloea sp.]|nr:tandem-95 repeat protein [Zoogloea sp.]
MNEGDSRTETFTVTTADGTPRNVTVTVLGTNETPTVANVTPPAPKIRPPPSPSPSPAPMWMAPSPASPWPTCPPTAPLYRDAAMTQPVTAGTPLAATAGAVTLYFQPAPNWNGSTSFHFTATDNNGGSSPQATATVNVTPANDAPLAVNDSATTTEDSPVSRTPATGVLTNDSDIDSPSLTVSGVRTGTSGAFTAPGAAGVTLTGTYGALLIRADGSYTYTPGTAAQALNTGDSVQDVFSYQLSDGSLTATANLSITVTGANDAAVITGLATGSVKEDTAGQLTATGTLAATDVDSPATFTPASASGTYGSVNIAADGTWTYVLNNTAGNVQALNEGDSRTETFTVTTADGTPRNVTVTVLGTNETPTVANVTASGAEDPATPIPVTLTGADVDGAVTSLTLADLPANGTLYRDAAMTQPVTAGTPLAATAGAVTLYFQPAPNWNGSTSFHFTATDNNGGSSPQATATVNVTPANDAPLAVNDSATTTEDSPVSRTPATGVLTNDSDIDSPSLTVSGVRTGTSGAFTAPGAAGVTLTGTYGALLIRADGSYTYTPGTAAQALNTGDSVQDVFSYQLSDGSLTATANLSITVTGANDAAVITGLATGSVKEDTAGQLTATGTLAATDVDSPATFTPASASGTYGSFNIAADGTWTYVLNNTAGNVQALNEGDSRTETFTVTTADGTPRNVTVTVLGTNETPTVANVTASGAEDPATPIPVTLTGADVDGAVTSLTLADLPANGTLYRDAAMTQPVTAGTPLAATAGAVTLYFQPAPNWNGSTSFHFTATDNNGGTSSQATASINVTPVNDPPVAIADTGSTDQNTLLSKDAASGVLTNDSDIDGGSLNVTSISFGSGSGVPVASGGTTVNGAFGSLLIAPNGSYTYTPGDAAKALVAGQSANDVFTYSVSDGNGGTATTTLTIQVNGLNDAPVIGGIATGNVSEDGTLATGGNLTITDPDAGQSSFIAQTAQGTYGTLSLQSNGSWSYSLDNASTNVQSLKQGEVVEDHFNVQAADGTVTTLVINVTGTNDEPVVGTATVNVSEEGLAAGIADSNGSTDTTNLTTAGGTISVSDVDGNPLNVTLTAPTTALTSNGVAITWTGSDSKLLIGSAGSVEIVRATISDDGTHTVKLSGPIDHPVTTEEDLVTLDLGIKVSDGVTTTTSTLTVNVEDDAPKAGSVVQAIEVPPQDTNLLIILDNSGSMNTADGVGGTTRLRSAITALNQLIDTYDTLGEVRIRIVTFNSAASAVGTTWTTVTVGKGQLAAVTLGGTTNYDAAIAAGQTAFTSTGKLASGQNVAYFLSDGVPNSGTGIGTADETAWKAFLTANDITSYALGMGTGASQAPLNPIAYDGLTDTNLDAKVISDFSQLSSALQATVPQSASGDILSGGLLGGASGFGADGGHIQSIKVDGITYTYDPTGSTSVSVTGGTSQGTYDPATHQLTVRTDDGGTLVVNMNTGGYSYTPRPTVTTPIVDGFDFVLIDKDGDTAGASVTFNVSREAEAVVTLTSTTQLIDSSTLGLAGEYYGYNETTSGVTRTHADDTTLGNLDRLSDMTTIVNGRSGETILGTYEEAPASGSDATFSADKIDYGFGYTTGSTTAAAVNGNLGNNPTLGANMDVNSGALYNFLRGGTTGSDAVDLQTTTGVGNTTDSGLRFVGLMNVAGGTYDIRVTADDGFRVNVGGATVAMFDGIQSPTERVFTNISLESGLQPIEIVYWEQGGNARLRIEVKLSSEPVTAYKTLGTEEFALFTPTSAPTLTETQDIIESTTQNGAWLLRSGERLDGTDGNDHITGSDAKDVIYAGLGNDTVTGGSGASLISGGAGNDTLTGGLGSDTFKWSLGDAGTAGAPAIDAITDFDKSAALSGGDVLDLSDLLQGESHSGVTPGNLGSYLHFEKSGTDTVVHISSTGGYTGGTFSPAATDQKIVLQGVDLTNSGALSTDAQIIQDLLTKGKLSAD